MCLKVHRHNVWNKTSRKYDNEELLFLADGCTHSTELQTAILTVTGF